MLLSRLYQGEYKYNRELMTQLEQIASVFGDIESFSEDISPTEATLTKAKHPGITELPKGALADWNPKKIATHAIQVGYKKGKSAVSRALVNLVRWNKKNNPTLSKKAQDVLNVLKDDPKWKTIGTRDPKYAGIKKPRHEAMYESGLGYSVVDLNSGILLGNDPVHPEDSSIIFKDKNKAEALAKSIAIKHKGEFYSSEREAINAMKEKGYNPKNIPALKFLFIHRASAEAVIAETVLNESTLAFTSRELGLLNSLLAYVEDVYNLDLDPSKFRRMLTTLIRTNKQQWLKINKKVSSAEPEEEK